MKPQPRSIFTVTVSMVNAGIPNNFHLFRLDFRLMTELSPSLLNHNPLPMDFIRKLKAIVHLWKIQVPSRTLYPWNVEASSLIVDELDFLHSKTKVMNVLPMGDA